MQAAISEVVNKKTGGGTGEGGTMAEGERRSFGKLSLQRKLQQAGGMKGQG